MLCDTDPAIIDWKPEGSPERSLCNVRVKKTILIDFKPIKARNHSSQSTKHRDDKKTTILRGQTRIGEENKSYQVKIDFISEKLNLKPVTVCGVSWKNPFSNQRLPW